MTFMMTTIQNKYVIDRINIMKKLLIIKLSLITVLFISCEDSIEGPEDEINNRPPVGLTATLSSIQKEVFTPSCAVPACHGGTQSPDLTSGNTYNNLVNVASAQNPLLVRVKPGDSANSWLVRKLNGSNTSVMPPTGQLSQATIDSIKIWIDNGAFNN